MTTHERYFAVDAVRRDLRNRSVRSGVIAAGARGVQILLAFGSVAVLARILTPEDFGVFAMVLPVTILVNASINHALQTSVIHRAELDHAQASGLFRLAARWNLIVATGMGVAGPALAWFYDDPRVTGLAIAWAAVLWLTSLSAVHEALLKRQMRFGVVMGISVGASLAGVVAAIGAALAGAGYWALFVQVGVMDLCRLAALWTTCRWRPARGASGTAPGVREIRRYWLQLTGFRALSWLGDYPDRILAGWVGGAAMLGLYDGGRRWAWYPFTELYLSLSDVAVGSFSRVRDDAAAYRRYVTRAILPVLAISLPAIAFLFVEARGAVLLLLGDQWLGAIPFVQLMAIAAFIGSLSRLLQWIYLSLGETARQLRWAMRVHTPVMLTAVLIGARWGALGVATGFTAGTCLLAGPAIAYCLHVSPLRPRDYMATVWRPVVASVVAAALLHAAGGGLPRMAPLAVDVLVRLLLFGAVYAIGFLALPGGRAAARDAFSALGALRPTAGAR